MITWVILATIFATALGGFFALRFSDKLHLILGFSAGTIMGVTFFDLIPESFSLGGSPEKVILAIAVGFVVYMITERSFSVHSCDNHCDNPSHKGKIGATTLIIHSLIDGLIIGLSFKVSSEIGLVVSFAVLAHKFSDGINTASILLADKVKKEKVVWWLIIASVSPVIGLLAAQLFSLSEAGLGLILGLFAGLFIYLGASDLIPESHHKHPTIWTTASTIIGMAIIFLITRFIG
jgi:ZIP family zinc transporter